MERPTAEPAAARAEIQPAGFLIAVHPDWRVAHVSTNIADHFADVGRSMAGQPLAEFFGAETVHALRNQLALLRDANASARLFSVRFAGFPKPFDIALHSAGGQVVLDALPAAHSEAGDPVGTVRAFAAGLWAKSGLQSLLREGAHQLRALTGYDRVTIFRWREGLAEQVAHDGRGKHDPARPPSQSPPATRFICDGNARCAAIAPDVDSSLVERSILRSPEVSELHDLSVNGARASLSLPLRIGDKPWGIALCLSENPKRPLLDRLAGAELFADLLAMRIEICELRNSTLGED